MRDGKKNKKEGISIAKRSHIGVHLNGKGLIPSWRGLSSKQQLKKIGTTKKIKTNRKQKEMRHK